MALLSYIMTTVLYCILYSTLFKYVPQPNETKSCLSFCSYSYPHKTHVYSIATQRMTAVVALVRQVGLSFVHCIVVFPGKSGHTLRWS